MVLKTPVDIHIMSGYSITSQNVLEFINVFLLFPALTVRYLTRRYIGEYKSNTGKKLFLSSCINYFTL